MPDRRRHRGRHPDDERLFAERRLPTLRTAVVELSWLLTRDYAEVSALKLVGDRYGLTARQRMAVRRCACCDGALAGRRAKLIHPSELRGCGLAVDGYNLLITVESALATGLILMGRDGCARDLASIHGTYRKVEETVPAVRLIAAFLTDLGVSRVTWYLDRPVSNSGRLKGIIERTVAELPAPDGPAAGWHVELVASPDRRLASSDDPVVTTDSVVLDRCRRWVNLAAAFIEARTPNAWCIDLGDPAGGA